MNHSGDWQPLADLKPLPKREVFRRRAYADEELARLIAVSGRRGIIYALAAYTGLRRNEISQLEWEDLCLEERMPNYAKR